MEVREIRKKFLEYFAAKGHEKVASSPVIPFEDPSLLFVNAGMNQFKDVFLGKNELEYNRAVTSQKCIRVGGKHNDLDNVGMTKRHLTFFEMLGNFSFGDYFKSDAIDFAWDFTLNHLNLDVEKLWVTIFEDDDESFELWKKHIREDRIVRLGEEDNFWTMGETGPCGPCTELHYDRGEAYGSGRSPLEDPSGERYFEFWNLVFMQFNRDASRNMEPLAKQSVDTGMGLERMAMIKQGVDSVFETDMLRGLIGEVERISGKQYDLNDKELAPAFRVIADHTRMLCFSIADGALPGNIERGYVLRKVLRRLVRFGRMLGLNRPFIGELVPKVMDEMGDDYPELKKAQVRMTEIFQVEEENFQRTLARGGAILEKVIDRAKGSDLHQISGKDAFTLKDTYGLPYEEICLMARDHGLSVNLESYQLLEEEARERSRSAQDQVMQVAESSMYEEFIEKHGKTAFHGYSELTVPATILGFYINGLFTDQMNEGEEGAVILDQTTFYAESGGQIGDSGFISHHSAHVAVTAAKSPYPGLIFHFGTLKNGTLLAGEPVFTQVDEERRLAISHAHTATHLLHWALNEVLGEDANQAGSLVTPSKLRFDFRFHRALTNDELRQVERLVNQKIMENDQVAIREMSYTDVKSRKDVKQMFGEKYGSTVRMVTVGEYSKELCGGTHVKSLGEIHMLRIVKETSVAAGTRRIEAVTDLLAFDWMFTQEDKIQEVADTLKVDRAKVIDKIVSLQDEVKTQKEAMRAMRKAHLRTVRSELMGQVEEIGGVQALIQVVDVLKDEFTLLANELADQMGEKSAICLVMKGEDRVSLLIKLSGDLVKKGMNAGKMVAELAAEIGGKGGGRPDMAQAGGPKVGGIESLMNKQRELLSSESVANQ